MRRLWWLSLLVTSAAMAEPMVATPLAESFGFVSPAILHRTTVPEFEVLARKDSGRATFMRRASPSLTWDVRVVTAQNENINETSAQADAAFKIMDKIVFGFGAGKNIYSPGLLVKGERYEVGMAETFAADDRQFLAHARWAVYPTSFIALIARRSVATSAEIDTTVLVEQQTDSVSSEVAYALKSRKLGLQVAVPLSNNWQVGALTEHRLVDEDRTWFSGLTVTYR